MNQDPSQMQIARIKIEADYAANIAKAKEQYWAEIRQMHKAFLTDKQAIAQEFGDAFETDDYKRTGCMGFLKQD